jgi:plastocyanin
MQRRLPRRPLIVLAVAAVFIAGCGDDETEVGAPDETADTVSVVGQDNLTWDAEELSVDAGTITVQLTCEEAVNHNFVIEELDEEVVACAPGETAEGTIELDAGEYEYVCTVPGHSATMRGTLTVS